MSNFSICYAKNHSKDRKTSCWHYKIIITFISPLLLSKSNWLGPIFGWSCEKEKHCDIYALKTTCQSLRYETNCFDHETTEQHYKYLPLHVHFQVQKELVQSFATNKTRRHSLLLWFSSSFIFINLAPPSAVRGHCIEKFNVNKKSTIC